MSDDGKISHILIAEGNRDTRAALVWCLLSEGFWVHPVANGPDAALALEPPGDLDLAIVDLSLRGCDMRRVIEGMRSWERLKRIPIIATGLMESFTPLPRDVYFLQKPFDFELLVTAIRALSRGSLHSFFPRRKDADVTPTPLPSPPVVVGPGKWLRRWRH